ncbi:S-layer homology domain-containing protein [Paenibacillus rhizovicinus]|uniref:S-layer homology domain-containing protein n=1 Tax=Paenibacillus rhizovicinus TaxID=2704463 RepID=A0A6C0NTQ7_9BACL|nr:S-layer homology domain-containing protein [Paenibacillus rhizovicinus]QHW29501.1 S-layer homology domain-containing protein [Paenibacillus rhizovicinus]
MSKTYKKRHKIVAAATAVATSSLLILSPGASAAQSGFKDVSPSDYFYDAVLSLQARNVIEGNADGTFKPYDKLTRGQAAKIIASALGLDTANVTDPGFKDVSKGNFYYKYISALANQGIIEGFGNKFSPNDTLTRAQMAKIITLAYKLQQSGQQQPPFADVKQGDWFAAYVGALTENEITTGTTPTTFSPNDSITRGQMAALVFRSEGTTEARTATISTITKDALVTSEGTYALTDELKQWINPSNLAALQGAAILVSASGNRIAKIDRIELKAQGSASTDASNPYANHVVVDGHGAAVEANITVNGDYVTLKNMTIAGDLHVGKSVVHSFFSESMKVEGNTTIDDALPSTDTTRQAYRAYAYKATGTAYLQADANPESARGRVVFSKFQLGHVIIDKEADVIFLSDLTGGSQVGTLQITNAGVKITLGDGIKIGDLVLPAGTKPSDVIVNYEAVKANIELINGSKIVDTTPVTNNDGSNVPQAPSAPTGVQGVTPTLTTTADGQITGLDAAKVYQYKLATAATWTDVPAESTAITSLTPGSYEVRIAPKGNRPASAATAVTVAASHLVEAVMLDGKDGVSSTDGKVETVRLKFDANIVDATISNDSFSVEGFDVASIKVTDKNGRTAPDPLNTVGEQQYITIRVTPKDGTAYAPMVQQSRSSIIRDNSGIEISGIHVQAKDQAAPTIIDAEYVDTDQNGADPGDQIVIKFSETVVLPGGSEASDLVDDFTLSRAGSADTSFSSDDAFAVTGNTVTVTLGAATSIKAGMAITISNSGVTLEDVNGNKAKPQKAFVNPTVYSDPKPVDIRGITTGIGKLVEAVMLDGKDGVSSTDGRVETVRLKFDANINDATVTNDSFSVEGFDVASIKVTDKNGRTAPDPLNTVGEQQYITIRVTPKDGTDYAPMVQQSRSSIIRDSSGVEISGIHVQAKDQAAPTIIDAEYVAVNQNRPSVGDKIVIQFSEVVVLPEGLAASDVLDDFTLINGSPISFNSDDTVEVSGNTVTITLGAVTSIVPNMTITISDNGVKLQDESGNKAKPQKAFVNETVYSNPNPIAIRNIPMIP